MTEEIIALRNYAHLGDAVWEIFVREYVIFKTSNSKILHKMHIHFWKLKFLIVEINKEIYQLWSRLVVCFRINCHKLIRAYDYPIFPVAICFKILLQFHTTFIFYFAH